MKRNILSLLILATPFAFIENMQAQVGIGTNSPNASAQLEISSSSKGFLPPRVTLTGTADATTIASPATGLLVYNTATAGTAPANVTPGIYYYDGAKWQRVINQQPDATVEFDRATPTTAGVVFTPNTPASKDYVYVSTVDNSQWTYNGSTYVTYTPPASTPWMLSGGTNDAGSNKSSAIYRSGNVGIGTGTTAAAERLQIGTGFAFHDGGDKVIGLGVNSSTSNSLLTNQWPAEMRLSPSTGDLSFGTTSNASAPALGGSATLARRMTIARSGNVGIGTTSPTSILNLAGGGIKIHNGFSNSTARPALTTSTIGNYEIRGVGSITGTSQQDGGDDGFLRLSAGGGSAPSTTQSSIDISGLSNNADMNSNIVMRTSGTERMRIISSGNVGIGTTSPADVLDVRSAISVNEIKFRNLDGGDDTDPYRLRKLRNGANDNELQLHVNDDANERFAIYGNSCAAPGGCADYSTLLHHYFRADGNAYHSGWLGIGTTSPAAPLHVTGGTSQTNTYIHYGQGNACSGCWTGAWGNVSGTYAIQSDNLIRATGFNAVSDARIKRDVIKQNTSQQLTLLNKLNVVNYSYIDKLVNGSKTKTGFIAQQVESVNPEFVNLSADFIPSVFAVAKAVTAENGVLTVITEKPHGFEKGDEVKLFAEGKKETIVTVEDVKSPNDFTVKGWTASTKDLFVYGKKVSDFRAIDFDQINALSVAAIQELSKQVDELKAENAELKKSRVQTTDFEQLKAEVELLKMSLLKAENK